jgi:hypothetical protein
MKLRVFTTVQGTAIQILTRQHRSVFCFSFGRKLRQLRKFKKQFIMVPADAPSSK